MSIEALILGKLHQRAEQRTSGNTGRQFVTAKVRAAIGEADAVFVNVVTFSESTGAALLALDAGDAVSLAGTLKPGAWIDREGHARPSLDLVASQVLTPYGLKKKRAAVAAAGQHKEAPRLSPLTTADGFDASEDEAWLRGGDA